MSTVYLIDGSIENGMQGVPFSLGIFTTIEEAQSKVKLFMKDSEIHKESSMTFSATWKPKTKGYFHYAINITPIELNKITVPREFS